MSKVKTPLINLVPNQNSKTELKKSHFQIAKGKLYLHATKKLISYFSLPESTIQTQPELQNGFCHPQIPFFCNQAIHPKKSLSQNTPRLTAVLCPPLAPGSTGALCSHRSRVLLLGGLQGSEHRHWGAAGRLWHD